MDGQEVTPSLALAHLYRAGAPVPQCPTLLLLQGGGSDPRDLLNLGRGLADEANLLSTGFPVSESGASAFGPGLVTGKLQEADPAAPLGQLADFVTAAGRAYGFDRRHVVAVGLSGGADVATRLLLLRSLTLRGAVLFHPLPPAVPAVLPQLTGVPVLIVAGRQDPRVAPEETLRLAQLLLDAGAAVAVSWHEDGQELAESSFRSARTWLRLTGLITQP